MRLKPSLLALAGTAVLALTTLGTGTAAQAAATSPGISPWAPSRTLAPGAPASCPSGSLCVAAWDANADAWKVFDLDACNRYYLSYWNGTGWYVDNQTGSVTSTFYGQTGNTVKSFKPDYPTLHGADWDPVWSIRNC
ncbi:hypothetical protein GCM10009639_62920 [Kitasatospora putterlickiae]|uniref:Peptidase inhibitor family I36 n=1 Tax=Kitasatospora putterlickiae TaxID=221725 RepID=A0ABN1YKZ8_9ACTN